MPKYQIIPVVQMQIFQEMHFGPHFIEFIVSNFRLPTLTLSTFSLALAPSNSRSADDYYYVLKIVDIEEK